jgi:hypothetical protein
MNRSNREGCRKAAERCRQQALSVDNSSEWVRFSQTWENIAAMSERLQASNRMRSTHPLAIELSGISGCSAVSTFRAIVTPPTSRIAHSARAPSPSKPKTMTVMSLPFQFSG